jgi:hypothetical protein
LGRPATTSASATSSASAATASSYIVAGPSPAPRGEWLRGARDPPNAPPGADEVPGNSGRTSSATSPRLPRTDNRSSALHRPHHLPALLTFRDPWVRIAPCDPAEMKDHPIPPPLLRPTDYRQPEWDTFWAAYNQIRQGVHDFSERCQEPAPTPALATTSSTRASGSTSTSIPRRSTTPERAPSAPTGTTSSQRPHHRFGLGRPRSDARLPGPRS